MVSFYVAELSHRVTVLDADGRVVVALGRRLGGRQLDTGWRAAGPAGRAVATPDGQRTGLQRARRGLFSAPHGIAVDSQGSFYVADTAESWSGLDRGSRAVQKFVRV